MFSSKLGLMIIAIFGWWVTCSLNINQIYVLHQDDFLGRLSLT